MIKWFLAGISLGAIITISTDLGRIHADLVMANCIALAKSGFKCSELRP